MTLRIGAMAGAAALQLVAIVLAHDLTFLARFGSRYGEELAHAGHGATWAAAVATSVVLAVVLAILAAVRLLQLGSRVRRRRVEGAPEQAAIRPFFRAWVGTAARIGLLNIVLLTIQENIERLSIGQVAPGPGLLLSPQYPFGLWIALAIGAAVGLVAALFQHRQRVLLARLRAARSVHSRTREGGGARRHVDVLPAHESILGRRSGLRAPPAATAA